MSNAKISIRFFEDREVRAVWDEQNAKWWFSVLDIVAVLTNQNDYTKTRNYWKYLKTKLRKENSELVSATTQLKLLASDGKRYLTDMLDYAGIIALRKEFPGKKVNRFIDWFTFSDESIDGKAKQKPMPCSKVRLSIASKWAQPKGCNKFMLICLADCMNLQGKSGKKIFQKGVFSLPYHAF